MNRFVLALLLALFTAEPAAALNPASAMDAYGVATWTTSQGLPQNVAQALAQTTDGYLWIGTQNGLGRFDGVRFETYNMANTPSLLSNSIEAVGSDRLGRLWIGTRGGVSVAAPPWSDSHWASLAVAGSASMSQLLVADEHAIWLAGSRRGLQRLSVSGSGASPDASMSSVLAPLDDSVYARVIVHTATDGTVWVATRAAGIQRLMDGRLQTVVPADLLPDARVCALLVQRDGTLWAGTMSAGVVRYRDGKLTTFGQEEGLADRWIPSLLEDHDGNVWIGTQDNGLFRFNEAGTAARLTRFSADSVLARASIWALLEDREFNLWVGTSDGLHRLRDVPIASVGGPGDLGASDVWTVMEQRPGVVWAGTQDHGLFRVADGAIEQFPAVDGRGETIYAIASVPGTDDLWLGTPDMGLRRWHAGRWVAAPEVQKLAESAVFALFRDSRDRIWIAWSSADQLLYLQDGKLHGYSEVDGYSGKTASSFAEDHSGAIWIGTRDDGLFRLGPDGQFSHWSQQHGLTNNTVITLYVDGNGSLWIATAGTGLNRMRGDQLSALTSADGLPADTVASMLEDDHGLLWLCTLSGLYSAPRSEFDAVANGLQRRIQATRYGADEGMRTTDCSGGFQPAAWKAADGSLWFGTESGLAKVGADAVTRNTVVPPVHIESVWLDGLKAAKLPEAGIAAGLRRISFRYTALSLQAPARVRFRHRLVGFDPGWIEGSGRTVSYTNLNPGAYRFRVIASNNDGVWNTEGASVAFTVQAPFYRTAWFYALVTVLAGVFVWMAYRVRTMRLRAQNAVLKERNRIARELHDTMAQGLIGIKVQLQVAEELLNVAPEQLGPYLKRAREIAHDSILEARQSVWTLRGGVALELDPIASLGRDVHATAEHSGLMVTVETSGVGRVMASHRYAELSRLLREAVVNVIRHAHAQHLHCEIRADAGALEVVIADDGCGFDPERVVSGFGVVGMRERASALAAELSLESSPESGTRLCVRVPWS